MKDIDFLPADYRRRRARRQHNPWRVVAVVVVCGTLGAVAALDYHRYAVEKKCFDAIVPRYEATVNLMMQLATLQTDYKTAQANAELYVYLRHPWPRTQILAALLTGIPDEITFEQLEINRVPPTSQTGNAGLAHQDREAEEKELAVLPPASRDLHRLREEIDPMQTVVTILGHTQDGAPLYRYLADVGQAHLFSKAELDSIENSRAAEGEGLQFRAVILVKPGYGQPGGPAGPNETPTRVTARWAPSP